ncbi:MULTISPECIES: ATP-binding protein [unclassified Streptomyces]|uniref:ATP-binding protein n=1 Tax=unclassified Streptomyces TaxID=2593676 RepID=UPI000370BE90|nr:MULTISPECIES: ATP-binding protein [unclassified Streptomyces]MYT31459.1 ATP-binding protein [Streptomyces sp. SID8354]
MDPNTHPGPEEHGEQAGTAGPPAPESAGRQAGSGGLARVVRLVSGNYLVTVNPVDGCEIQPCPPGERPAPPEKLDAQERAAAARAAQPPVPSGPVSFAGHEIPLEERDEDIARLERLLSRGRSVRVTGPAGSGRTRLLDAVAGRVADLAPDGVVRLSGYHRTVTDVLYALFAAVYRAPQHRPERPELLRLLGGIGAVVVLDDLEFGGAALDELLDATPECAFLLAATPDVPAPSAGAHVEEVFVGGIGKDAGRRLLERALDRPLTKDETAWAADLWFESEGLPLRFVQGAALLRQRDKARIEPGALDDGYGLFPEDGTADPEQRPEVPLPAVGEAAAPAPLLAERLGAAAQETLRFAVALNGELPHQAHLPALTQDTHADAALGELLGCGLISPAGGHYRLAATVQEQLTAAGYAEGAPARAHTAAQHYAWWAGHPSVTPERAAAESDAVLATMGVLTGSRESGHPAAAVLLARTAAPAFAAALHWSAWERSLRHGQEAARLAGEVAEEAYFHHDLGVLALCSGNVDRARAELEASIGLRGVLSDRDGAIAGRRALALVIDRSRAAAANAPTTLLAAVAPASGDAGAAAADATDAPEPRDPAAGPAGEASPDAVSTAKLHAVVRPEGPAGTATTRTAGSAPAAAGLATPFDQGGAAAPRDTTAALPLAAAGKSGKAAHGAHAAKPGTAGKAAAAGAGGGLGRGIRRTGRRNLLAVAAGVVLAGVLGTVVTLGMTSDNSGRHDDKVTTDQSPAAGGDAQEPAQEPGTGAGLPPTRSGTTRPGTPGTPGHRATTSPSAPGTTGAPSGPGTPTGGPTSASGGPTSPTGRPTHPTHKPTDTPTHPTPTGPTGTPDPTPTGKPTVTPTGEPSTPSGGSSGGSPSGSNSAVAPSTSNGSADDTGAPSAGRPASGQSASGQGTPAG